MPHGSYAPDIPDHQNLALHSTYFKLPQASAKLALQAAAEEQLTVACIPLELVPYVPRSLPPLPHIKGGTGTGTARLIPSIETFQCSSVKDSGVKNSPFKQFLFCQLLYWHLACASIGTSHMGASGHHTLSFPWREARKAQMRKTIW